MQTTSETASLFERSRSSSATKAHSPVAAEFTLRRDNGLTRELPKTSDVATISVSPRAEGGGESLVSDEEYHQMVATQAEMAAKMVMGELSTSEILRLRMLRWAIDRAEAARHGEAIRRLESLAQLNEDLARQVNRLIAASKK